MKVAGNTLELEHLLKLYPFGHKIDASVTLSCDLGPVLEPWLLLPTVATRECVGKRREDRLELNLL